MNPLGAPMNPLGVPMNQSFGPQKLYLLCVPVHGYEEDGEGGEEEVDRVVLADERRPRERVEGDAEEKGEVEGDAEEKQDQDEGQEVGYERDA